MAAYLAENALWDRDLPSGVPVAPELLVPRLGEYLISKGLLSEPDLEKALAYQRERSTEERPVLFGQALLELALIDREKLDHAITEQILELQTVLRHANRRLEQRVQERTGELQNALSKLAELNQLKSNFISNISHELRTPLTHIKGYVELLADESLGPISLDQASAIEVMQRAADRLEGLVNDLLRFSRASQGEFTLRREPIPLAGLLEIALQRSNNKARKRKIDLTAVIPPDLPLVDIDEEKVAWLLHQLIDNAIKFTDPGGAVALKAMPDHDGVVVSVKDTGIGIETDRIAEIFEPFHQLDGSSTRRHGGTGLGLALVRRILDAHGVLPRIRSTVGVGTEIQFTLPIHTEALETGPIGLGSSPSTPPPNLEKAG